MEVCFHCGDDCLTTVISHQKKSFCCHGCKTVYDILNENDLAYYYDLEKNPGTSPQLSEGKFDFLENEAIVNKLLEFNEGDTNVISFLIPNIHCSSCIWVLENLNKLNPNISASLVNFPEKSVRITFSSDQLTVKDLVHLLSHIGYEPYISLDDFDNKKQAKDYTIIYKLGVAGFAFGNIMFLSFPEYFEVSEFWLEKFKHLFRWLMFAFSLPVVFYSGQEYFTSAYKGLRSKMLNIDVPIALGITVLFVRSTLEIIFNWGSGFFDSLSGLIFFLLLGKFFQQKTYSFLSFERDYRSYFPIGVTKITSKGNEKKEVQTQVYDLKKGDRILIRNQEIIPTDAILIKGNALINYSFVTGEANPVNKQLGEQLFAGGKQEAGIIEVEVTKAIQNSYLTKLWSNAAFDKNKKSNFESLTDSISKRFTLVILGIALAAMLFWLVVEPSKAMNVFTAVLIVACPCAIALAAPFTLGNLLRIFGKNQFYVKNSSVLEQMSYIDTVIFDKTGTITTNSKNVVHYEGIALNKEEEKLLTNTLRASNHPLSRALYSELQKNDIFTLDDYEEKVGKGIIGKKDNHQIKAGSFSFTNTALNPINQNIAARSNTQTAVHVSADDTYKGCYIFNNQYREGLSYLFETLQKDKQVMILSGDNDGERTYLQQILPKNVALYFNQKPDDKLRFIKNLQNQGKRVMMIGDGLNDSGALAQCDVGIVVSENINVFSPACDGILEASKFKSIIHYFKLTAQGHKIIKWAFAFSLFYNLIGLGFAISGNLAPVVAAILMPLSSISIVAFTTIATTLASNKLLIN